MDRPADDMADTRRWGMSYTEIKGVMWCTEHDDISDELNDGSICAAVLYDREPDGTAGEECALVPLYIPGGGA